ncbi:MAG: addiction module antidote protein [Terrimicrobiaceae bacterium]
MRKAGREFAPESTSAVPGTLEIIGWLGPGIMELKIDFGPGYRVYYAKVGDKIILLLCGGDKTTKGGRRTMKKTIKPSKPYEESLLKALQDPNEAVEYLNASLEEAIETDDIQLFLLALKDIAKAKGMSRLASVAKLNRESMYKMLSRNGNPEFGSLWNLLNSLGLKFAIEAKA